MEEHKRTFPPIDKFDIFLTNSSYFPILFIFFFWEKFGRESTDVVVVLFFVAWIDGGELSIPTEPFATLEPQHPDIKQLY